MRAADVLLPAAIVALGAAELWVLRTDGWLWGVALEAVAAAALVGRARWPWLSVLAVATVLTIPWTGTAMDEVATPVLVVVVALFALGRRSGPREGPLLLVVVLGLVALDYALVDTRDHDVTDVVFALALTAPPLAFGRVVQRLDSQRRRLREQQEQIRLQAARAERTRIARELHDVVAHSVSAMVLQTAAAQDLVDRDPGRAAGLLASVAETGREALDEIGRLLHVVRDEDDELGLAPAPGLADVPALVDRVRAGGLEVDARVRPPVRPLPASVDVSAYRLVQEALTNASRYAAGPVSLLVEADDEQVRIRCANPVGGRVGAQGPGSGLGLTGMAERVALLGGSLRHGEQGGSFEVDATLPLTGVAG